MTAAPMFFDGRDLWEIVLDAPRLAAFEQGTRIDLAAALAIDPDAFFQRAFCDEPQTLTALLFAGALPGPVDAGLSFTDFFGRVMRNSFTKTDATRAGVIAIARAFPSCEPFARMAAEVDAVTRYVRGY